MQRENRICASPYRPDLHAYAGPVGNTLRVDMNAAHPVRSLCALRNLLKQREKVGWLRTALKPKQNEEKVDGGTLRLLELGRLQINQHG
jgi:hypothetical protein